MSLQGHMYMYGVEFSREKMVMLLFFHGGLDSVLHVHRITLTCSSGLMNVNPFRFSRGTASQSTSNTLPQAQNVHKITTEKRKNADLGRNHHKSTATIA